MRPKVTVRCVAAKYAAREERVIEFSHKNGAGLISLRPYSDGSLVLYVYAQDPTVEVRVSGVTVRRPKLKRGAAMVG